MMITMIDNDNDDDDELMKGVWLTSRSCDTIRNIISIDWIRPVPRLIWNT